MQNKPLVDLIHDLEQEMLRLGYANISMRFYRSVWQKLLIFSNEKNEIFYSEQLGIDFIEKHFGILEKSLNNKLLQHNEIHTLRIIRMVGDFQLHHAILRRYCNQKKIITEPYFMAISNRFKKYCIDKAYSKTTINHHVKNSSQFIDYIISQNVTHCNGINLDLIHAYIKTLTGYTYHTIVQNIGSMRVFFRFILEIGEVQINFAEKMPNTQARKHISIPSVWTADELKRLIAVIDRGNPNGKRAYAIILLACCLGMRCTDIKNLKLEHFHWENKQLIFIQSKTKTPLSLPITQEVGWAVIDYLKYGRPKIDSDYLFVRHMAPFGPLGDGNNFTMLIRKYMELAHIPVLKKKRGMHSLRHTMAGMLLEKDTPLAVISDILGHIDTNSTAVYLKVGIKKLKECSLTLGEENKND